MELLPRVIHKIPIITTNKWQSSGILKQYFHAKTKTFLANFKDFSTIFIKPTDSISYIQQCSWTSITVVHFIQTSFVLLITPTPCRCIVLQWEVYGAAGVCEHYIGTYSHVWAWGEYVCVLKSESMNDWERKSSSQVRIYKRYKYTVEKNPHHSLQRLKVYMRRKKNSVLVLTMVIIFFICVVWGMGMHEEYPASSCSQN